MKASELVTPWKTRDNKRLTNRQFSIRLPAHIAARVAGLRDLFHKKTRTYIMIAGSSRQQQLPEIKQAQLVSFSKLLRSKLLDRLSGFGKEYLKLLVSEIRIKEDKALITGSNSALAHAVADTKKDSLDRAPSFVPNWLT